MSAYAGNLPRWSVGRIVQDKLLGQVKVVAVNPKIEPHWDYTVERAEDRSTYVTSDGLIEPDALAELVVDALAGSDPDDHGPGCDGPFNCVCSTGVEVSEDYVNGRQFERDDVAAWLDFLAIDFRRQPSAAAALRYAAEHLRQGSVRGDMGLTE